MISPKLSISSHVKISYLHMWGYRIVFLCGFAEDLSRWTAWLSRGVLSSKIGSSLCSAKLRKFLSFKKRPFCGFNTARCRRSLFYLVIRSSLLLRFYTQAFLQLAWLLSADYSEELCSGKSTFQLESVQETCLRIFRNIWKCLKVFKRLWSYLKAKRNSRVLVLTLPLLLCRIGRAIHASACPRFRQK